MSDSDIDSENTDHFADTARLHLWNMASCEAGYPGFHMPGHAGARHFSQQYRSEIISIDSTELSTSDDLHDPKGPALRAMQDSSRIYGSGETLYITTGSTTGIHVMIASIVTPDTFILLPRTVHMSVLHVLALLDCRYGFIETSMPLEKGLIGLYPQTSLSQLREAFRAYPQATDVLLVSPDYYGQCVDMAAFSEVIHDHGCLLLVDEAHGSHLAFAQGIAQGSVQGAARGIAPKDAMQSHADMCVQSLHKTLPALTMASLLHISQDAIRLGRVSVRRVWDMLRLFETSSPSFVIAASSEYAINWMDKYGRQAMKDRWNDVQHFVHRCKDIPGLYPSPSGEYGNHDPMRLVLRVDPTMAYAPDLVKALESKGIFVEFSDLTRLLLIVSPWHSRKDFDFLFDGLRDEMHRMKDDNARMVPDAEDLDHLFGMLLTRPPEQRVSIRTAFFGGLPRKEIDISQAAGEICASAVIPYPPGIPLLWPGEVIANEHVELLLRINALNRTVRGVENDRIDIFCR